MSSAWAQNGHTLRCRCAKPYTSATKGQESRQSSPRFRTLIAHQPAPPDPAAGRLPGTRGSPGREGTFGLRGQETLAIQALGRRTWESGVRRLDPQWFATLSAVSPPCRPRHARATLPPRSGGPAWDPGVTPGREIVQTTCVPLPTFDGGAFIPVSAAWIPGTLHGGPSETMGCHRLFRWRGRRARFVIHPSAISADPGSPAPDRRRGVAAPVRAPARGGDDGTAWLAHPSLEARCQRRTVMRGARAGPCGEQEEHARLCEPGPIGAGARKVPWPG